MSEWERKQARFGIGDIFGSRSRWHIFWNFVVKRRSLFVTCYVSPPESTTTFYIDEMSMKPSPQATQSKSEGLTE